VKQASGNMTAQVRCAGGSNGVFVIGTHGVGMVHEKPEREEMEAARNEWHAGKRKIRRAALLRTDHYK
jgi:hypothetical protein